MGCSINAFYDIDQEEIQRFIDEIQIDTKNDEDVLKLRCHFYEKITGNPVEEWNLTTPRTMYSYNRDNDQHVLYEYHQCKYIRDHKLVQHQTFPPRREEVPFMIRNCLNITSKDTAIETIKAIREYTKDDEDLNHYADWLEKTSKYCYAYHYNA